MEEQKRDREFITDLVQWLSEREDYFKEKSGEMVAIQIAQSAYAQVQEVRQSLKRLRKSILGDQTPQPNEVTYLQVTTNLGNLTALNSSLTPSLALGRVYLTETMSQKDELTTDIVDPSKK
jgi:hypothetical protein